MRSCGQKIPNQGAHRRTHRCLANTSGEHCTRLSCVPRSLETAGIHRVNRTSFKIPHDAVRRSPEDRTAVCPVGSGKGQRGSRTAADSGKGGGATCGRWDRLPERQELCQVKCRRRPQHLCITSGQISEDIGGPVFARLLSQKMLTNHAPLVGNW